MKVGDYLFLGQKCHHVCEEPCWWQINGISIIVEKTWLVHTQWFFLFLVRAFAPKLCKLIWSFSSWPLLLHQWPPNPVIWKTRCLEPTSRVRATLPYHQEAERILKRWDLQAVPPATHHLGLWQGNCHLVTLIPSTVWEYTWHLLKRQGATPQSPHAWTAPVVEDMLCHRRTGLTKAMVTGPGWGVPFYGRQSLGEGLSLSEVRDTAFTLTGAGTLVGKSAYLAADPLTIQEGQ